MLSRITMLAVALIGLLGASARAADARAQVTQAVLNYATVQPGQQAVIGIVVDIKPGFHAQSHTPSEGNIPFTVKLAEEPLVTAYDPAYPPGKVEKYAVGVLSVYTGQAIVYVPFEVKSDAKPGPLKLTGTVGWQICDEDKCFAPEKKPFTIETSIVPAGQPVKSQFPDVFKGFDPKTFSRVKSAAGVSVPPPAAAQAQSNTDFSFFGLKIGKGSYLLAFFAAFVAGIMFNAVPCVLPVLPLKALGFYEVSQHNRAKCLAFGAVFSAGLIASFGVLAIIVVVGGYGWGQLYSNVWFNLIIVLVLLAFAIGTFGFFTVNVPTALYSIAPRHDTYLGNFLFGILTAVLSTPCTFGLFLGLLVWASSQPRAIGVGIVMIVGVGMAFPYFLLSAFPQAARKLPRSGPWAELVKQEMSFLLLGSAVFFARRFIQPVTGTDGFWWLLFAVAVGAAVFLFVRAMEFSKYTTPRAIAGAMGTAIIVGSLALTIQLVHQPYTWTPYSPATLSEAQQAQRVVVVEFTATWCTNCQYVETHTLHEAGVVKTVKQQNVQMLKADLTNETAAGWDLLKQISPVAAIPFTAVYAPGSKDPIKLEGIYNAADLRGAIERAASLSVARG